MRRARDRALAAARAVLGTARSLIRPGAWLLLRDGSLVDPEWVVHETPWGDWIVAVWCYKTGLYHAPVGADEVRGTLLLVANHPRVRKYVYRGNALRAAAAIYSRRLDPNLEEAA